MRDLLRRCYFRPYLKGRGPTFRLDLGATNGTDWRGQTRLEYRLLQDGVEVFAGSDFSGSPMHADDSDDTVRCLMGFLTLRPGDTDSEYFENYTPEQLAFCDAHAEALQCCYWRGKDMNGLCS